MLGLEGAPLSRSSELTVMLGRGEEKFVVSNVDEAPTCEKMLKPSKPPLSVSSTLAEPDLRILREVPIVLEERAIPLLTPR